MFLLRPHHRVPQLQYYCIPACSMPSCFSYTAATNQDHVCFFQFHARYLSVLVLLLVSVPHLSYSICLTFLFLFPVPCFHSCFLFQSTPVSTAQYTPAGSIPVSYSSSTPVQWPPAWSIPVSYSSSTPVQWPPGWSIPVFILVPRLSNSHLPGPFLFLVLVPCQSNAHLPGPFPFLI